ncbi:MAG: hypothetical protein ABUL63_03735, partial [Acidobacteriota bacterium]
MTGGDVALEPFPERDRARPVPPSVRTVLDPTDTFVRRHLGSSEAELREMLGTLGLSSFEDLVRETVPGS